MEIGNNAFADCTSLNHLVLPESLHMIGASAFQNCKSLTSLSIPSNVSHIGYYAIFDCENLTSLTVSEQNPYYFSQNNCLIDVESKTLVLGLSTTQIPDNSKAIGNNAFAGCPGLANVTLPDSVEKIGVSAFAGCTNLESITWGENLTVPDDSACPVVRNEEN